VSESLNVCTTRNGEAATARQESESCIVARNPETGVERRRGSCADAFQADREQGDDPQGIETPTCRRRRREFGNCSGRFTGKPKSKPKWKAWSLYGEVCRREVLEAALWQVIANGGAPGVTE